jgi:outer membrane protein
MPLYRILFAFALLIVVIWPCQNAHALETMNLEEVVKASLDFNKNRQRTQLDVKINEESVLQARSRRLPNASASLSLSQSVSGNSGEFNFGDYSNSESGGGSIGVSQALYEGGRIELGIENAKKFLESSRTNLKSLEQSLIQSAVEVYLVVYYNRKFFRLARENEDYISEIIANIEGGAYSSLKDSALALSKAKSRLAGASSNVVNAESQLASSEISFKDIIGVNPSPKLEQFLGQAEKVPASEEEVVAGSKENNLNIVSAKIQTQVARNNLEIQKSSVLPSVSAFSSIGGSRSFNSNFNNLGLSTGISASISLYSGGSIQSSIRQSAYSLRQQELQLEDTIDSLEQNARQTWQNLKTERERIQALEDQLEAAINQEREVLSQAVENDEDVEDLINARETVRDTLIALDSAKFNEYLLQLSVLSVVGDLTIERLQPATTN